MPHRPSTSSSVNSGNLDSFGSPDLDRPRRSHWIAGAGLAVLVALVAACSGAPDDGSSSASALSRARWVPTNAALLVGERVRLTYDDAPSWTSTRACAGRLRPGGRIVGELLMDKYAAVASVGGYACRRNTADTDRMSVHGTGRALDVMIPTVAGAPNRAQGDKIANWLILNAQQIGVQLIIWNRSIWRSNGTNDDSYGGPSPHTDHLHVELTEEAAAHTTKWFTTTEGDAGGTDGSTTARDSGTRTPGTDSGTDTDDDAGATTEPDAAPLPPPLPPPPPPPTKDAGVKDSAPPTKPDAEAPDTTTPPDTSPSENAPGSDSAGDAPGEPNSLPTRPTRKTPTVADDEPPPDLSGCSAAPGSHAPLRSVGSGLALALGLGAWLRRRRRGSSP